MLVAHFLQRDADSMGKISVPDADLVWRRALRRSPAEAIAHAARPIQWVVHTSIAAMITAAFWLILVSPAWFGSLPAALHASTPPAVEAVWVAVAFAAVAVTILTALFGAMYILQVDRVPVVFIRNIRTREA